VKCQLSICGEMAGDPLSVVVLLGLGYETFSMSASSLMRVKSMLLNVSCKDAEILARRALKMPDSNAIYKFMAEALNQPEVAKLLSATPKRRTETSKLIA
jgi:phosphotransferase system enzyme I (PtsP)